MKNKKVRLHKEDRNPEGGLSQKGRDKYNRATGSHLKPGVKGTPKTPDDYRRKGSFLSRFYGVEKLPPLTKPNGKPTRLALAAAAWGEPVPRTEASARRLAAKGRALLAKYKRMKEKHSEPSGAAPLQLLSQNMVRIPLGLKGQWFHDEYGTVRFDDEKFSRLIQNYNDDVLGFKPYSTYGHLVDPRHTVDGELKKGELRDLQVDGDVLYGDFEVNNETYQLLSEGQYEYSSPEIIQDFIDKNTGENRGPVLVRTALTNAPFLPFGQVKIEMLSQSAQARPHEHMTFAIKLIHDDVSNTPMSIDNLETGFNETEAATEVLSQSSAEVLTSNPIAGSELVADIEAIKGIIGDLSTKLEQSESRNSSLLKELSETKQLAQQFSTHVSRTQEELLLNSLSGAGVPPVFVQRFSQLRRSLLNSNASSQTIKLSVRGQEVDRNVVDEVAALLVDAFNANEESRVITEPVGAAQYAVAGDINERLSLMAKQLREAARK